LTIYFTYLKEIFSVAFLSFLIGNVALKGIALKNLNAYTKTFLAIFLGVLFVTIFQAIIATKLNTVLLIVPFLLLLGYFFDKKNTIDFVKTQKISNRLKIKNIFLRMFEVSLIVIVLYSIQFIFLFENANTNAIRIASQDLTFYARCADYIKSSGIEVCNNDYLFSAVSKPYHFADLWFNAAISSIGENVTVLSLVLTSRVIYLTLVYLGFLAIVEVKYPLNFQIKIVCALSIFFTPLYFDAYSNISVLQDMSIFAQTLYQAQKLFFIQVSLIASIILYLVGYKKLSFATIICIPILYTVTILPILASYLLCLIYGFIAKKKVALDEFLIVLIASLYMLIFYLIFNSSGDDVNPYPTNLLDLINLRHTVNIIGGTILKHIILYFPLVFLLICYIKKIQAHHNIVASIKQNPDFIFIVGMPFAGLVLWSVTSGYINAVQFFQNIAMPIFYTGAILILVVTYLELGRRYKYLIIIFLLLSVFFQIKNNLNAPASHGIDFIKKINQEEVMENNIYVVYKPASWYRSIFQFGDKGINLGNYLSYVNNNMQPVSLDMIETPIIGDSNFVRTANESLRVSTFYRYVEGKRKVGINKTNVEYQEDFIKENNIRVLVTLKAVHLPEHLQRLVINRIEDDISDEVVCILSNSIDKQPFDEHH